MIGPAQCNPDACNCPGQVCHGNNQESGDEDEDSEEE